VDRHLTQEAKNLTGLLSEFQLTVVAPLFYRIEAIAVDHYRPGVEFVAFAIW